MSCIKLHNDMSMLRGETAIYWVFSQNVKNLDLWAKAKNILHLLYKSLGSRLSV